MPKRMVTKEGWINIYPRVRSWAGIWENEETAKSKADNGFSATIKITWQEEEK
jgi:hypothetical protein